MERKVNISGVVLAGGANSRFGGRNKAKTLIGGGQIILRILYTLRQIFDEIIIVTNTPDEYGQLEGVKIARDHFLKVGPLGGIHASMKVSSKEAVFIFAGDMPFLNRDLIISQIDFYNSCSAEAVIPEVDNKMEPLHGIFKNSLLEKLEIYLAANTDYSIRNFLLRVDVSFFKPDHSDEVIRAFTNINSPEEAKEAGTDTKI